jgi:hypothetical protein
MRHIAVTFATLFLASLPIPAKASDCDYGKRCSLIGDLVYASMLPGDSDTVQTGRAFMQAMIAITMGNPPPMPDKTCSSPRCVGIYMALQEREDVRSCLQHAGKRCPLD